MLRVPLWGVLLAACALTTSSYWAGLSVDDHLHRLVLMQPGRLHGAPTAPSDLFRFVPRSGPDRVTLFEDGLVPWWASDSFAIAFYRPVSASLHKLDYLLWPDSPWLMHVHSQLWLCAVIALAALLYRRMMPSAFAAQLAILLFALDDAHGEAVGWIAGRNAIVAGTFALAALWLHTRSTDASIQTNRRMGFGAGALCLYLASLLSSEIAVSILAYIIAYSVFMDQRARWVRAAHVGAYVLVTMLWQLKYRAMGYGVSGSGLYIDPIREPVRFVSEVAVRTPYLIASQLTAYLADFWSFETQAMRWTVVTIGLALVALFVFAGRHALRKHASARFWLLGALLSLLPACTKIPSDRLLLFFGFGAFGFVASCMSELKSEADANEAVTPLYRSVRTLLVANAACALMLLPVRALGLKFVEDRMVFAVAHVPHDEAIRDQTLIVMNSPHPFLSSLIPVWSDSWNRPRARRSFTFGLSEANVDVERVDAHTLRVRPRAGYLSSRFDGVLIKNEPLPVGFTRKHAGIRATVMHLNAEGKPDLLEFRFDLPLDDAHYRWVSWRDQHFEEVHPPARQATFPGASFELL